MKCNCDYNKFGDRMLSHTCETHTRPYHHKDITDRLDVLEKKTACMYSGKTLQKVLDLKNKYKDELDELRKDKFIKEMKEKYTKPHNLDGIIKTCEEIYQIVNSQNIDIHPMNFMLRKLRYESIKWMWNNV